MSELSPTSEEENQPPAKIVDNKTIVTPYAFGVSDHLLNHPLASPSRRLCAIIVDLLCIAILSTLNATILAGLTAITFVRANIRLARQKRFKRTRIALSLVIAFLLYIVVYGTVTGLKGMNEDYLGIGMDEASTASFTTKLIELGQCSDFECKRDVSTKLSEEMAITQIPQSEFEVIALEVLRGDQDLSEFERDMLVQENTDVFTRAREEEQQRLASLEANSDEPSTTSEPEHKYSVFQWIKGTIKDFGIGFGWAALYFSALPTYWNGATPGKRLFGIYVVRLDGRTPSLWENFGRYGGYTAGFATGLMGFLQVLWDPNRQAIQDKISETLVLRKQK
jgi:uncharacterized RDD family membrane protein YckC